MPPPDNDRSLAATDDNAEPELVRGKNRVRGVTLTEELQGTLEDLIISGSLKPGTRLDEADLIERFKVSRTPVREALRSLAGHGLVELRGNRGTFVASISLPVLIEMFQMMGVTEGLCAQYAARRATKGQREELRRLHDRLTALFEKADYDTFYQANQEFHDALYDASNTQFLAKQARSLRKRVGVYRRHVTFQPGRMAATIGEHLAIIAAIENHDSAAAFKAAADHVNLLQDDMVDLIAAVTQSAADAQAD